MTTELVLLAASIVIGIVHIIVASQLQSWQRGYRWTASSREQGLTPLTGVAGRAERALRNYLETFPFFAAAVLVVTVMNTHSWTTVALSRTRPPIQTSSSRTPEKLHPRSLLSIARLNFARSRLRCSSCKRTRIVHTSFGFKGRF